MTREEQLKKFEDFLINGDQNQIDRILNQENSVDSEGIPASEILSSWDYQNRMADIFLKHSELWNAYNRINTLNQQISHSYKLSSSISSWYNRIFKGNQHVNMFTNSILQTSSYEITGVFICNNIVHDPPLDKIIENSIESDEGGKNAPFVFYIYLN